MRGAVLIGFGGIIGKHVHRTGIAQPVATHSDCEDRENTSEDPDGPHGQHPGETLGHWNSDRDGEPQRQATCHGGKG